MNTDLEGLLRDGMERFTKEVRAPTGLARTAGQLHRRRLAARAAVAAGTALVAAAAVVAVVTGVGGAPGPAGPGPHQARTVAYLVSRVEHALAGTNLVFRGRTVSTGQTSVTWAYGPQNRFEELTGSGCGHAGPDGTCTHRGGSEPYLAEGTALIGGKLTGVYVTYYNREWSSLPPEPVPSSACSATGALEMGGPPVPTSHWSAFINATLACGAASVTGQVRVGEMVTTRITGSPVKVRLAPRYAKLVGQKWAQAEWTLYVNPKTYLPVRIYSSTRTFGGPGPVTRFESVTDVRWLPPSAANVARSLVTIPPGFRQVNSPADQ